MTAVATASGWGIEGVTVRRGRHTVLDDVTLPVPAGAITAVVGGDGAGKTTLARVLVGRAIPDTGVVRGADRRRTGFLPATSGVWGDLSVAENVDLVAGAYRLGRAVARTRADELLTAAGLDGVRDRLGRQLSGGMRQKLGFCLVMLHRPELVVLDEPSTGVDPVSRVDLWRLLSTAAADGTAVLLTTTYLDEAERAATVLVLDRGVAVYRGDPALAAGQVRGSVLVLTAGGIPGDTLGATRAATEGSGEVRVGIPGPPSARGRHEGELDGALAVWRRGGERHALVARGVGVAPRDLEDAVIALTVERTAIAPGTPAPAPGTPAPAPGTPAPATGTGAAGAGDDTRRGVPGEHPERASRPGSGRRRVIGTVAGAAVEATGVVTEFGGFRAVDDVSLTVRSGRVVGLLGANGAGKTTLIRTVLGLVAPSSGTVRVLGGAPSRDTRRRVGYVPQGLGLAADLTVAENLEFAAAAYRTGAAPELPEDLAPHAGRLVGSLSLGLQRRLAFTVALSHAPELLVLDEPTSGVDPLARAALWDTVHAQAESGVAVLVTTHYMQEAEQCDELVLMSHGRRVAAGTLADVLDGTTAVEVTTPDWQAAFGALTAAGLPVTVAGRAVRVAGAAADAVAEALRAAGVPGEARTVPARLEEVMVLTDARG
jgi:ABC-2 type transport system ATP-binding protein